MRILSGQVAAWGAERTGSGSSRGSVSGPGPIHGCPLQSVSVVAEVGQHGCRSCAVLPGSAVPWLVTAANLVPRAYGTPQRRAFLACEVLAVIQHGDGNAILQAKIILQHSGQENKIKRVIELSSGCSYLQTAVSWPPLAGERAMMGSGRWGWRLA